ncbi:hypothetical protein WKW79_12880 [Variovorax robiniae]|uniref:Uncharacterized protein n=1 Tax=Variovorax robiniae TaxID=1836199 RepID=A0ABU8X748_9BURK
MALQDLALSVREMSPGTYSWVILQGTGEQGTFTNYSEFETSEFTHPSYSDALVAGFSRLRALGGRDGPRWLGPAVNLLPTRRAPDGPARQGVR